MELRATKTESGWEILYDGFLPPEGEQVFRTRAECEAEIQRTLTWPGFDRAYALGIDRACGIEP